MSLAMLSVILGVGLSGLGGVMWARPEGWRVWAAEFPRSKAIGYVLVLGATAWFLWNVRGETLADFTKFKPFLLAGFGLVGVLTCIYVTDYLAARGLAVLLLLGAKLMVDTARHHVSDWRWVVSGLAYVWVVAGIWWTISPWRLRNSLAWLQSTSGRLRVGAIATLVLGVGLILLGVVVFPVRP
jgi:hypothetical protein